MSALPDALLVVVDKAACLAAGRTVIQVARAALDGGARWLWYRNWIDGRDVRLAEAAQLADCAQAVRAALQVGGPDAAELATALGAGVHLPSWTAFQPPGSGPPGSGHRGGPLVGRSCHDLAEVRRAQAEGAAYATLSPVFASASPKPSERVPLGPPGLAQVVRAVRWPVLALGGVVPERVAACLSAGAAGVAALGFVCRAPQPGRAVAALRDAVAAAAGSGGAPGLDGWSP